MARLWRVRDRRTFAALRREGTRRRAADLTVTRLPGAADTAPPAVAFALGRSVGTAVVRNRLRRRLRALLAELDLPAGTYLVSASPRAVALPTDQLRAQLREAVS